jgi:hypothetical protein
LGREVGNEEIRFMKEKIGWLKGEYISVFGDEVIENVLEEEKISYLLLELCEYCYLFKLQTLRD